ncbi:MAG: hypothetical protein U9R20_06085 [Thermodesulfobacteriota bacterium]|nr:hypothetical protein [Candidatus Thermoplasmatota archaeon]MEA3487208.1 hypothetical protein [Thermodesulfobacteriota bacterium]
MKKVKLNQGWWNELLPEGLPYPTSTLISGPGGSGKPLVGFSVVYSWLKEGGSLIFILTNTGKDFVEKAMKEIYNIKIEDYKENLVFIEFDPSIDPSISSIEKSGEKPIKANLVNPKVWDEAIKIASSQIKQKTELGTLVFASALNLPLFSRTYGESILKKLGEIIKEDKTKTYLFTVSTSAYKEKIRTLEDAADNLLFTRNEKPMKLLLRITRMKDVSFSKREIKVPLKTEDLLTIKNLAEESRTDLIPIISKI